MSDKKIPKTLIVSNVIISLFITIIISVFGVTHISEQYINISTVFGAVFLIVTFIMNIVNYVKLPDTRLNLYTSAPYFAIPFPFGMFLERFFRLSLCQPLFYAPIGLIFLFCLQPQLQQ